MSADAYSNLKALRHLDIIDAVREQRPVRPAHVQIILSDLCNQSCDFCAYRDPSYSSSQMFYTVEPGTRGLRRDAENPTRNYNPNRMMPTARAIEILDDCRALGVSGVQFTGGGEPTVHPHFVAILDACGERLLPYALVTNGVLLARDGYALRAARAEWVRVSIDAARPETYTAMRHVGLNDFRRAWDAVEELAAFGTTTVGVGFVVTPANWREIAAAAELAKRAGANNIRIGAQFSVEDERLFAPFHAEAAALAREAEALTDEKFTVYNRFSAKIDDLRQRGPDYDACGYQHFTTYIGADLNVYRCCVLSYNERGLLGSLKERSFRDLWMSEERAAEAHRFNARGCDRCQFNAINRVINYATAPSAPAHSEFV